MGKAAATTRQASKANLTATVPKRQTLKKKGETSLEEARATAGHRPRWWPMAPRCPSAASRPAHPLPPGQWPQLAARSP